MALGIGTTRRQIPLVWQSMIYPFKTSVPTFGFCMSLYRTSDVLLHPFDLFLHWYYWRHKIDTFFQTDLIWNKRRHIFFYFYCFSMFELCHITLLCRRWCRNIASLWFVTTENVVYLVVQKEWLIEKTRTKQIVQSFYNCHVFST